MSISNEPAGQIWLRVCGYFVLAAVVLMPLGGMTVLPYVFGEFSYDGAFYPLLAAVAIFVCCTISAWKFEPARSNSFKLLAALICWVIISGTVRLGVILESSNKGRTGLEKFALQLCVLVFAAAAAFMVYQIGAKLWKQKTFNLIGKAVAVSFFPVAAIATLEVLYIFNISATATILAHIRSLYRANPLVYSRVHSLSAEASAFGCYLAFAFPWLCAKAFNRPGRLNWWVATVPAAMIFAWFSFSRITYFLALSQFLLFGLLAWRYLRARRTVVIYGIVTVAAVAITAGLHTITQAKAQPTDQQSPSQSPAAREVVASFTSEAQNPQYQLRNIGRLGPAVAALKMGMEQPATGVGLGQYGFFMSDYLPEWAWQSYEVHWWADPERQDYWPPAHNVFARLLAELGVAGLLLWLAIWASLAYEIWPGKSKNTDDALIRICLFTCLVGVFLTGFNWGTLRFAGYWLSAGLVWAYHSIESEKSDTAKKVQMQHEELAIGV